MFAHLERQTSSLDLSEGKGILEAAAEHDDCFFMAYTNGTLLHGAVVERLAEIGNLTPAISLEEENMTTATQSRGPGRPRIRFQPDVRITVRFRVGRDEDLLAWLERLPDRRPAKSIRQALRLWLRSHGEKL